MERTILQSSDGINHKHGCNANIKDVQRANRLSGAESEATNAFTSGEFTAIKNHHEEWHLLQQGEASEHESSTGGEAARSSQAANKDINDKASDSTQVALLEQCRSGIERATLRLNANSQKEVTVQAIGTLATDALYTAGQKFVLTQSQHDVGFKLQFKSSYDNQKGHPRKGRSGTCIDLIFDPNSDVILLCNKSGLGERGSLVIRQLPLSRQDIHTNLVYMAKFALNVASYSIYISREHILDITILPRRYVSFITEPRNQMTKTNKRAFEPSSSQQASTANKRAKSKEMSEESSASAIFQTAPTHPLIDEPEPAALSSLPHSSNSDISVVAGLGHPLEQLQLDNTLKIVSATKEEDYELTRRADLSVQKNSLVYKAHYSKMPGRLVVTKIWRSQLEFSTDSASAINVSSVGNYWLNEVQNHFKIGLHPSIATYYAADARLLSLYMEYINAPNLQFYCERRRNTFCKLDYTDARRILFSIADALDFIHKKGITHDDIKPANILYSKDRGPVLIDFGWSSKGVGHCAGSPWYIPPEYKFSGERGPPGDVFAMGVVMLFLLRMIPLPELQSPPLTWHISHLRRGGPDARKAAGLMDQWLSIVKRAKTRVERLENALDNVLDESFEYVMPLVSSMLEFDPIQRIPAGELFDKLRKI